MKKIILFPIYLFKMIFKGLKLILNTIREKKKFSIQLTLSLKYIRILLGAMVIAGLGIITIFGVLIIQETVFRDYSAIIKILNEDNAAYTDTKKYSEERESPILIYDNNKDLIFSTHSDFADYGYKGSLDVVRTGTNTYLAINRGTINFGVPLRLIVYSNISQEISEIVRISKIIISVFSIILFFSVISIALAGRGIFQPIKEMTQTVKDISEKNLNLRLNVSGSKNELKELALTFNEMMNRIEDYYNRQRQFVSDASHELRTPIAVIQGYTVMLDRWGKNDKGILQESITAIKNESENMNELIDKLLFLARHDKSTFVFEKE